MATLTIRDLTTYRALDTRAMTAVRGGGAPWLFGWIQPYVAPRASTMPSLLRRARRYRGEEILVAEKPVNRAKKSSRHVRLARAVSTMNRCRRATSATPRWWRMRRTATRPLAREHLHSRRFADARLTGKRRASFVARRSDRLADVISSNESPRWASFF